MMRNHSFSQIKKFVSFSIFRRPLVLSIVVFSMIGFIMPNRVLAQCLGSTSFSSLPTNVGCGEGGPLSWDGPSGGNLSQDGTITWTVIGTFRVKRLFPGGCTGTPTVIYGPYFTIGAVPLSPTAIPNSRCDAGSVTLTGIAGTNGNTLRWYNASTGGSLIATGTSYATPSISTTTTYYISSYNTTTTCEGTTRVPITATINPSPSIPIPAPNYRCGTGTVLLSGSAGANGNTLRWYDVSTGGSPLATATSYTTASISTTTTYYITSYSTTTACESTRVPIVATINTPPSNPTPSPAARCGAGALTLTGTPGSGGNTLRWYDVSTGGSPLATATSYTTPSITTTTTYYISSYNSAIDCEGGGARVPIVATINPLPAPPTPIPGGRCGTGTVLLSGTVGSDGTTLRWYDASSGGTLLATATSYTTPSISTTTTYYITSYNTTTACESTRVPIVATINTPPSNPTPSPAARCGAGALTLTGTPGSGGNTLRWYGVSTGGSPLATATSYTTPSITTTTTYYISSYNSAIDCEGGGARVPIVATINPLPAPPTPIPGGRCGTGTVLLSGTVGSDGTTLRWYDASSGGTLLATATSYTTPSISTTTTYYITTYNATTGCESTPRTAILATISAGPSTPTPTPAFRCGAGTVTLSGTIGAGGNTIRWYDATSGGTLLATATSYTTPSISATTTYYIASYNTTTSCEGLRAPIIATVNVIPSNSTPIPAGICTAGTVVLSGTVGANGNTLRWYSASTGGTLLATGTSYTTPSISTTTTYYISSYNSTTTCEGGRVPIAASIYAIPSNPTPTPASRCGTGNVTLGGTIGANGNTLRWYSASAGGTLLATANTYTTPSISVTTTYYITSYNSTTACESPTRIAIVATVNATPANPTPAPASRCGTGVVALSGTVGSGGTGLNWYTALSGGTPIATGTSYTTPTITSTTTYYIASSNTTSGCESGRIAIAATVNPIPSNPTPSPAGRCDPGIVILGGTVGTNGNALRWYNASTGGTLLATGTSYTTPSISVTTTYYISSYNSTTTCEGGRVAIAATISLPPSNPTPALASRCGTGTIVLGGTVGANGNTLRWYSAPTGGSLLATATNYTTPSISASTIYYITSYNSTTLCESSTRIPIVATVNVAPGLASGSDVTHCGASKFVLTAAAGSGATGVKWYSASTGGSALYTGLSFTTPSISANTTYYISSYTVACESARVPVAAIVTSGQPTSTMNYTTSTNVLVDGVTNPVAIGTLPIESVGKSIQYFDGLGRPVQSISNHGSPSMQDIVQPMVYDEYGREHRKYLAFVAGCGGSYKSGVIAVDGSYTGVADKTYANNPTGKIDQDSRPFSETIFEASPLSRPLQNYGPGSSWGPSPGGSNKFVAQHYLINVHNADPIPSIATQEKVIAWKIDAGMPIRETPLTNFIEAGGYYSTGQLYVNVTADEQNNAVREYTNRLGQIILKKVQIVANSTNLNSTTDWALTYYLYDNFGNLRYVFQPELSKAIHNGSDIYIANPTVTDLKNFAFQYKYDARKRMTEKCVPGADWVYMVYDNRDRLVLTQDGNQRTGAHNAIKYWTFTKYDELNRPILTGIKDTTIVGAVVPFTQANMQNVVDAYYSLMTTTKTWRKYSEKYVGAVANSVHGYTNFSYPSVTTGTTLNANSYLTVTYYDNYNFRSTWVGDYYYLSDGLENTSLTDTYTQVPTLSENQRVKGQVTGSKIKVLEGGVTGGSTWLKSINYFDDKYRVIQTKADSYKGGIDRTSNVYDFTGKLLKTKLTYEKVFWKDVVGAFAAGNKITRTVSGVSWNASGAASVQQLPAGQDGWMEVIASETNLYRMVGLSDANTDANFASIDYAWSMTNTGQLMIYESGASRGSFGSYASGDVLRIERTGTSVKYYHNGILKHPSTVASSSLLMVDVALYDFNSTVAGVRTSFSGSKFIQRTFEYDHAGRLTKTWHQVDAGGTNFLLSKNEYNELGQLVDKKLHSTVTDASDNKQSIDYRYNIRGWLTSMNNSKLTNDGATNDELGDLFGMNLSYQNDDLEVGSTGLFNGNISGMRWSSMLGLGATKEMGYNFTYDALNRLKHAKSRMNKNSTWQTGHYHEDNLQYDLNGNIQKLHRQGEGNVQIDDLDYNYGPYGAGTNQLQFVQENTTSLIEKSKGFNDGNTGGTDFTYDANGNLTRDLNKGIGTSTTDLSNIITYNYLNLPETVSKGGNSIRYIYDAMGRKLSQIVTAGTAQKQTDYVGEFTYENDVLQYLSHEEGRVVMSSNKLIYTNSFDVLPTDITSIGTTPAAYTLNGQKYLSVKSNNTNPGNGILPLGGPFDVVAGERYRVRVKGYRTNNVVYLRVKANTTVIGNATLPNNLTNEGWVEQIVTIPIGATATTMQAGLVWGGTVAVDELFYLNEFEITKLENTTPEYQYNLKDHLGNVRLTFTTQTVSQQYTAGFETSAQSTEASKFSYYPSGGGLINTQAVNARTGTNSEYLNGGYNGQIGIAKSFAVMPGDQLQIQAYAKYNTPSSTNASFTNFVASLLSAFSLQAPLAGEAGTAASGINSFGAWEVGATGNDSNSDPVKVFATILLFDKNYSFIDVAYAPTTGSGSLISKSYTVKEPGYAYLFVSNEHPTLVDVYIDDVSITYTPSAIIATNDYYPFGLNYNSYQRENSVANQYKFNGKEEQEELDLDVYDYGARFYDPSDGRWWSPDPLAYEFYSYSPYNFSLNNPINVIDPDGRIALDLNNESQDITSTFVGPNGKVIKHIDDNDHNVYFVSDPSKWNGESKEGLDVVGFEDPNKTYKSGDNYEYYNPREDPNFNGAYLIPAEAYDYNDEEDMKGKHDDDDSYIRNATHSDSYLMRLEKIIWRDLTADENRETVIDAALQATRVGRIANKLGLAHKLKKQSTGKAGKGKHQKGEARDKMVDNDKKRQKPNFKRYDGKKKK